MGCPWDRILDIEWYGDFILLVFSDIVFPFLPHKRTWNVLCSSTLAFLYGWLTIVLWVMTLSKIRKPNCILSSTTHQASEERGVIGSFICLLHIVITGRGYFNWWMFLEWLLILGLNFFRSVFGALVVPRIEVLWDCVFDVSFVLLGRSLMLECLRLN